MDEKRLKIEFSDSIGIGFAELLLKSSIERANKLDVTALDEWYSRYTEKYKKYEVQAKEIGLDFYTTKIRGIGSLFFHAYAHIDQIKAEAYTENFKEYAENALRMLKDTPDDTEKFRLWFEKYRNVGIAAEFLINYKGEANEKVKYAVKEAIAFHKQADDKDSAIKAKLEEQRQMRERVKLIIQPVEGRDLDSQQLDSIAYEAHNQLILAGAGTGKTTTIVGNVKYLLRTCKYRPEELLLLSFTNKSAAEMKERVQSETGYELDVKTFHKLGLDIITEANGKKPSVFSKSIQEYIRHNFNKYIADDMFKKNLLMYCFFAPSKFVTEFDVSSQQEYDEFIKINPPITIKRESVKSYCEMEIANFLYRNGINYTYEKAYEVDTADKNYAGYHPDFYLDDYGIYVEFYAVDKQGRVPSWFKSNHNRSAVAEYHEGIQWKRKIHSENGTKLVEVSFADKQEGKLTENLQIRLEAMGVKFNPKSDNQLWREVQKDNANILSAVCDVIGTVISLAKSRGYTYDKLVSANSSIRNIPLLELIRPVFADYNQMLEQSGQIDFNDMILTAAECVRDGKFKHKYKYVIVDEYQDMSSSRYELLRELRRQSDYNLFCVGDDWQSIYRFAGSDIGFILNFERYWGNTHLSKIENTYRFSEKLIDLTSRYIMKNPNQTRKSLRSGLSDSSYPLDVIEAYNDEYLMKFTEERVCELERNSTVFFIGRYKFDKEMFRNSSFKLEYHKSTEICNVTLDKRPDLKMEFMTVHKSKGLQADYIFIINNKKKGLGFPSRIQDDPLIQILLDGSDTYPLAEERRLFYVAMTRAKKKVWLLVKQNDRSCFVDELMNEYEKHINPQKIRQDIPKQFNESMWICPECGGRLVKRNGRNGVFIGCSNYSKLGCKYTRNIKSRNHF